MQIKQILINTSTIHGTKKANFNFSKDMNLLDSNGINSRGKTSLIRFIIWGLGYNINFTSAFSNEYSEVKLILDTNKGTIFTDRDYNKIIININRTTKKFLLPKQESKALRLIFDTKNVYLVPQLLGLFYYDQDQGLKEWNRGRITQSMGKGDTRYKLSIEAILFGLMNRDYFIYGQKEHRFMTEQRRIGRLIKSITPFLKSKSMKTYNNNKSIEINDRISAQLTYLSNLKRFLNIYMNSRKKTEKVYKLLHTLNLYVKNPNPKGAPIPVKQENILNNKFSNLRLTYISKYYKMKFDQGKKKLKRLDNIRDSFVITKPQARHKYDKDYISAQKNIALSGLSISTLRINKENLHHKAKRIHDRIVHILKNNVYYNKIWNFAHKFSNNFTIANYFSVNGKKGGNKLLSQSIPYSGAQRSLIIFSYRLSIYHIVMRYLHLNLPIILDSPGSQEMDKFNLKQLIKAIRNNFPNTQLIVASNYNVFDNYKDIQLKHGLFGDIK